MLRNYTHNSLQRSYLKPKQLVKAAKEKGWNFVGICDENTLSGMVEFYKECKENDIKPVIGCEFWVDNKKFPLFALNRKGLNRMISACSKIGCGEKLAKKDIDDLRFDKNIVEHHDITTARYIEGDEKEFELVIIANKNARPEDIEDLIKNSTFVKGYDSEEWLKEVKQKVVDKVKDYELASRPILTSFPCPDGLNEDEYVRELCRNGWKDKLIPSGKVDSEENKKKYADRVKYELDVLQGAGLSGYFLVVWDVVNYVREKGWLPGPGRGSAAGCLVSYLMGITQTDPIEYDLLFSRFYNKSRNTETRIELPDIDLDIPSENRKNVLEYVEMKYGKDRVCHIGTFGTFQGRSALEISFKHRTSMTFTEIKEMTKTLPEKAKVEDQMEEVEEDSLIRWTLKYRPKIFSKWCRINDDGDLVGDYAEEFRLAIEIEGIYRSLGKHAAGVVISPTPIHDFIPIRIDKEGDVVTTLSMKDVEYMGGVKFDFLGVDILSKVLTIVKKSKYIKSIDEINNFEDPAVWDLICSGKTKGVFQLDSTTGQTWAEKVKPRSINELSDLSALLRPGALGARMDGKNMTQHYVDRKFGVAFEYLHPALEPILKSTHGIITYQEQAMKIATELAGFSEELADDLRKAIGKKNAKLMKELKVKFIEGCKKKGIVDEKTAIIIYENIEKANRYSFNKSHSVVYAINAYWSAYCKVYDKNIFFETYFNHAKSKPKWKDEIKDLFMDCKNFDVDLVRPSISKLYRDFTYSEEDDRIYYGVDKIKDVSSKEIDKLIDAMDQMSLKLGKEIQDFTWNEILILALPKINKKTAEALIYSGVISGKQIKETVNKMVYEYQILKSLNKNEVDWINENYV